MIGRWRLFRARRSSYKCDVGRESIYGRIIPLKGRKKAALEWRGEGGRGGPELNLRGLGFILRFFLYQPYMGDGGVPSSCSSLVQSHVVNVKSDLEDLRNLPTSKRRSHSSWSGRVNQPGATSSLSLDKTTRRVATSALFCCSQPTLRSHSSSSTKMSPSNQPWDFPLPLEITL